MDKALTTFEILKIAGLKNFSIANNVLHSGNRKILTQKIINQYAPKSNVVQELFPPKNVEHYLIHYQTGGNDRIKSGHWACIVIDNIRKHVLFFDSYGIFPDNQLNYIDDNIKEMTDQDQRDIGYMLYAMSKQGFKVFYNDYKFQKNGTNTCGRYCGLLLSISKNQLVQPDKFKLLLDKFHRFGDYDEIAIQLSQNNI